MTTNRVFRLQQPWRAAAAIAPWWLAMVAILSILATVVFIRGAWGTRELIGVAFALAAYWIGLTLVLRTSWHDVRHIQVTGDGRVIFTTLYGRQMTWAAGRGHSVRVQKVVPIPNALRIDAPNGQFVYVGRLENRAAFQDLLAGRRSPTTRDGWHTEPSGRPTTDK